MNCLSNFKKHPLYPVWLGEAGEVFGPRGPIKVRLDKYGYERFNTKLKSRHVTLLVHRLVAEIYLGARPEGMTVNHKDGNKRNNSASNLEYITSAANVTHAFRSGLVSVCVPIEVNGVRYHSLRECERRIGVPRRKLRSLFPVAA